MNGILLIENDMGRLQERKQYENRVIDIDILFFNDEIIHVPGLVIPHREIENRRFVLEPLNEIGPGITHPVLKKGISSLLSECRDRCKVVKY